MKPHLTDTEEMVEAAKQCSIAARQLRSSYPRSEQVRAISELAGQLCTRAQAFDREIYEMSPEATMAPPELGSTKAARARRSEIDQITGIKDSWDFRVV